MCTRRDAGFYGIGLRIVTDDRDLKSKNVTEWEEKDGIKMRESTDYPYTQDFLFTIDGIQYKIHVQSKDKKKVDVDSLDAFLKFIEEICYIK